MAKIDHFNFIGPVYDRIFGRGSRLPILEMVDLQPDHHFLDVGGGTGRVGANLTSISPWVIIADPALRMLHQAQKKSLLAVNAVSEWLPFGDRSFERIIMVDTFHHVADHRQTLDEAWRILKPGGRLIIEEPDIHHWAVKLIALAEKLLLMRSQFHSPKIVMAMCDFDDVKSLTMRSEKGVAWVIIEKTFQDE